MEIPVLVGRAISAADRMDSPGVVVINQSIATKFFPGENPIGKRITIGKNLGPAWIDVPREVVGVAGDARSTLEEPVSPTMYTPFTQVPANLAKILLGVIPVRWAVRTYAGSVVAADELSDAVHAADSSIAAAEIRLMSDLMQAALARWRFNMMLLGAFAGVALALAAIGICGVVSYSVSRRMQEIGIRMALGARRSTVLAQVVGWGMKLACVGTVLGVVASLGLTRLMRALLFGVSPTEPAILASVSLVLLFIALLACLIPARRAASIHPVQALRSE